MATEMARQQAEGEVASFEYEGDVAQQALVEVVEVAAQQAQQALAEAGEVVAKDATAAAMHSIRLEAAMELLEKVAPRCHHRRARASPHHRNGGGGVRRCGQCGTHGGVGGAQKAYRDTDDADEEGRMAKAVAFAIAWGFLGKEEEDPWQLQRTHHRSAARTWTVGSATRKRP
jgi:hypothetical protein